ECNGVGRKVGFALEDLIDTSKSLNDGAIIVPFWRDWDVSGYASSGFFDNDKKLADYTTDEMDLLLRGKDRKYPVRVGEKFMNASYLGILEKLDRSYVRRETLPERTQKLVGPYLRMGPCPLCKGARLSQAALGS